MFNVILIIKNGVLLPEMPSRDVLILSLLSEVSLALKTMVNKPCAHCSSSLGSVNLQVRSKHHPSVNSIHAHAIESIPGLFSQSTNQPIDFLLRGERVTVVKLMTLQWPSIK